MVLAMAAGRSSSPPDPSTLRDKNRRNREKGRAFEHPDYPPPFNRFPDCCYEGYEDVYGHLRPFLPSPQVKITTDRDPYAAENLALAQIAIDRYRSAVAYPAWSNRIADYPAPYWCHKQARAVCGGNFGTIEVQAGHLIEWYFDHVMPLLSLRAFVLGCFRLNDDPAAVLKQVRQTFEAGKIEDIEKYLVGIARRNGERPPAAPRGEEPLTQIVRPPLTNAIEGWDFSLPEYDPFFEIRPGDLAEFLEATEVGVPTQTPEEWLTEVRGTLDSARAKAKENKLAKFGGR